MIRSMYAIRDNVADGFLHPMIDNSDEEAIRNFEFACMRNDSLFFTHTKDYDLYQIGNYDTHTGIVMALDLPKLIYSGSQIRKENIDE